ncbi:MAG: hypothetical protein Q7K42_05720 [Candidatus Diapherotrites archaeon]|nr:hypothetical protein [Candidatus Diapherotrites archaeon]
MAQDWSVVGPYAFLVGVAIAVIGGVAGFVLEPVKAWVPLVLVVLGLVVGWMNVKDKHLTNFLIAVIALAAVQSANLSVLDTAVQGLGGALSGIVQGIAAFVAPAGLVVALKAVWTLAKGE